MIKTRSHGEVRQPFARAGVRWTRVLVIVVCLAPGAAFAAGGDVDAKLASVLSGIPADLVPSGVLYDRVLPLSSIGHFDGSAGAAAATPAQWRQMYSEIRRASVRPPSWPDLPEVAAREAALARRGVVPVALMDFRYERIRSDALTKGFLRAQGGRLEPGSGDPFLHLSVLAAAPSNDHLYYGGRALFRFDRDLFFSNAGPAPSSLQVDFGDGLGYVPVSFDRDQPVHYTETGPKTVRIRLAGGGGGWRQAAFTVQVEQLDTPAPNDTMNIVATIPYLGRYGTGQAYVDLAPQHSRLTNPVIVPEGFDLDNSMNWPELYALLNRQQLLETLRSLGYDIVVLNFTDATDYVQVNSFVLLELIREVQNLIDPWATVAVAGPSMGGLCSRYALAWMEANGIPHRVRNFISFDAPQEGADIPLGIQYWVAFFADDSSDAAAMLAALDSPAARQMLVYHHTDPPGGTGQRDPLRTTLINELAALGGYPHALRKVAVANGSGDQENQGFNAGDQIIQWEYSSFLVDITGDVWSVPSVISRTIFHGLIDIILLPPDEQYVTVNGTAPYDNAPGGYRDTMAQMDSISAPYGDIIALHPNHCFIPSISSLDVSTNDLFYNIAGDPNLLSKTPFDAVYYPAENQEHVDITPENVPWLLAEVQYGATAGAGSASAPPVAAVDPAPNPVEAGARIRFTLPHAGEVRLAAYDAAGRLVAQIAGGPLGAGEHVAVWDGRGEGQRLAAGVYFLRLTGTDFTASRKVIVR